MPNLCKLVWILRWGATLSRDEIAQTIHGLLNAGNVVMNCPAVEAGLVTLEAGRGFAGGVITREGAWLGGNCFVSFDKKVAELVTQQGQAARLLI